MNNIDSERINELVVDEWIWVLFIILSALNIGGDELEKDYCYNQEIFIKSRAKKIFNLTVFCSFLIYLYLASKNYKKYYKAKVNGKDTTISGTRCIGSVLVVIASFLFLIAQFKDKFPTNPSLQ